MKRSFASILLLCLAHCGVVETIGAPRVRIMSSAAPGDGSFGDLTAAGAVLARAGEGAEFELESSLVTDLDEARALFAEWRADASERDLLVFSGELYESTVREAGCDFGGASVLLVGAENPTCGDLRSVRYQVFEPAYLAGVAAVSDPAIAPTLRVGVIAGADIPAVHEFIEPFRLGVEARGGSVEEVAYVSTTALGFLDPEGGAELAREMAPRVDVIFEVAGESGIGVGAALEALDTPERTYLIGAETDFGVRFPSITVGSVLRRVDYTVRDAILEFIAGNISSGNVEVGFRDQLTEFVLAPTFALRPIGAGCEACDLFDVVCLSRCETLEGIVEEAMDEALAARAER